MARQFDVGLSISNSMSGGGRQRGNNWTKDETMALLEIYGAQQIKEEIEKCFHNSHVWRKIEELMAQRGFKRNARQCKDRMQNVVGTVKRIEKTGKRAKTLPPEVLGHVKHTWGSKIHKEGTKSKAKPKPPPVYQPRKKSSRSDSALKQKKIPAETQT